ncbi:MAG: TMEM165/GDT1 family protein [Thermoplasmata archaeon]|nr:TMEM165/GDT1 family protein [Thermoplasmata archaeon]
MEVVIPFLVAFGMIIVMELGDKTQLMTISFASRYSRKTVFLGAWLGMGLITVVAVAIGLLLGAAFDIFWVKMIAAVIFIAFGVWTLIKREEEEEEEKKDIPEEKVFIRTFFLFVIAEFGDKTQLAMIALTATYSDIYGAPVAILIGAVLGFAVVVAIGVLIGREIEKRVDPKWIVLVSGILFIVIGIAVAIEALFSLD